MESACRTIHGRIVVVHCLAFPMAVNGGGSFWGTEAHAGDSEWLEEVFLNRFFPSSVESLFNDRAGDDVAKVGIAKPFGGFFAKPDFGDFVARKHSLLAFRIGGKTCGV